MNKKEKLKELKHETLGQPKVCITLSDSLYSIYYF